MTGDLRGVEEPQLGLGEERRSGSRIFIQQISTWNCVGKTPWGISVEAETIGCPKVFVWDALVYWAEVTIWDAFVCWAQVILSEVTSVLLTVTDLQIVL